MDKNIIIATHDGVFHSDDVFAVAALLAMLDAAPVVSAIIRTRDGDEIRKADFVVDVGGNYNAERNRFDHHQIGGAGKRPNGIPFSSFGLVWQKFGANIAGSAAVAAIVDKKLVAPTDARDCGVDLFEKKFKDAEPYDIDEFVHNLRPTWQEDASIIDTQFLEAVAFARKVLEREVAHAKASVAAEAILRKIYDEAPDKRIIILGAFYSYERTLAAFPEPLFVVYPRQDGSWAAKAVRDDTSSFKNRKDFPESWAGLRDAEFAKITGVPDAIFCHTGRFMAVARTKEGATALAKLALIA